MGQEKSDKKTIPRKKKKNWAREKNLAGKKMSRRKIKYWPSTLTPVGQFHPIHEIPERDCLDGALVGAGSLKPSYSTHSSSGDWLKAFRKRKDMANSV
jgi:hypothetical protein